MTNKIGWGAAFSKENGYGMAAVTGAEIGYGTVVINSYSGDTNISSIDADNKPAGDTNINSRDEDNKPVDKEVSILAELPVLTLDTSADPTIYLYFLLSPGVSPVSMTGTLYWKDRFYAENIFYSDGLQWMAEFPEIGLWYVDLEIVIDSTTTYNFISNTLTV